MPDNNASAAESTPAPKVKFQYVKSNTFRVIHVDGVLGSLAPSLDIHVSLFNERLPIPQQVIYRVTEEGTLGDEIEEDRVSKQGVVREVEAMLVMDPGVARSLSQWLDERVKEHEVLIAKQKAGEVQNP